jgi:hypothetical protein
LLVVAQAGCTAMDVVSILRKKRQAFTRYEVRVSAEQRDDPPPHVFERADRPRRRWTSRDRSGPPGDRVVGDEVLHRPGNLASGVTEIHHASLIHGEDGEEHYGEVVVTGPYGRPDALGHRVAAQRA